MKKGFLMVCFILDTAYCSGFDRCFNTASRYYKIPAKLLKAVAKTETEFKELAIHVNKNRTYDIGIMQINSSWLNKLNKVGISRIDLLDGCKNIQVGAWILSENFKHYGFNDRAIGAYNSTDFEQQKIYAQKVLSNIN